MLNETDSERTPHGDVVKRALIPCGGRGTRMAGLTGGSPKELLPVAGVPALQRVASECGRSGITELLIVIAPGKEVIADFLRPLAGKGDVPATVDFVVQQEPRGLADAIRLGREFASGGPLAVALPDNLFPDEDAVAQLKDTYARLQMTVVGMVEIFAQDASRRGATPIYPGYAEGSEFVIQQVPEKGGNAARFDTGGAKSAFTGIGRYVLHYEAFDVIDEVERTLAPGVELDDIAVMQRLLARGRLIGRRLAGRFLDVGLPEGLEEAAKSEW
jgi:UTP--glucose-1-phosphate uridylyltransferase